MTRAGPPCSAPGPKQPAAGAQPPIVATTANAFGEDRAACLSAGMDDHIAKPVESERLYGTLLRWLATQAVPEA